MQCTEDSEQCRFPSVGADLIRCILEAAANDNRETAFSLLFVCKTVYRWIIPIIYHTLVLTMPGQIDSLARSLPDTHAGVSVRRLIIVNIARPGISPVVLACLNIELLVTDISLMCIEGDDTTIWPAPRQVLLISRTWFQVSKPSHPLLRNATHLYIDYPNEDILDIIVALPRLTHLAIGVWEDDPSWEMYARFAARMLDRDSIGMLLFQSVEYCGPRELSPGAPLWVKLAATDDTRLFAGKGLSRIELFHIISTDETMWDDALVRCKNWREKAVRADR